jgi:hypothetical protein
MGVVRTQRRAGVAACGQRADLDFWVPEQQPEEFSPCVPTRTCDRDPNHMDDYASVCNFNQSTGRVR